MDSMRKVPVTTKKMVPSLFLSVIGYFYLGFLCKVGPRRVSVGLKNRFRTEVMLTGVRTFFAKSVHA